MQQFLRRSIVILLTITVLLTPLLFTFVNVELFEFNKMLFVYAAALLALGLWMLRMILAKRIIFRRTPLDIPLLLFLGGQLLALLFSLDLRTSFLGYYTRFHGGLLSWLSYAVLYWVAVSTLRRRDWWGLSLTMVLSLFGSSLYSFPEHFGHSPSCLVLRGKFDVSCWVQDVQQRVFGTFGQPNWQAAYIVTLLPLAGLATYKPEILGKTAPSWLQRWGAVVTVAIAWTVLLFTKSRSGILAAAVSVSIVGISAGITLWRHRDEDESARNVVTSVWNTLSDGHSLAPGTALITLLLSTALVGTPWTPAIGDVFQNNAPAAPTADQPVNRLETGGTDSGEIRTIVWSGAVDVWKRYPLFGSGPSTFAYSYYQDRPLSHNTVSEWDFLYNKAHNELLDLLATTGIVGLSTYLFLMGAVAWLGLRILWDDGDYDSRARYIATAVLAGHAALHTSNFFGFSTVTPTLIQFLLMGMLASLYIEHSTDNTQKKTVRKRNDTDALTGWQYIALIALSFTLLLGVAQIWRWWRADWYAAQAAALRQQNKLSRSAQTLDQALALMPNEPFLYESLSLSTGQLAVGLAQIGEATSASQVAALSVQSSNESLRRNPHHLNFYRSQARLFLWLSELDESYLTDALDTVRQAQSLAPTDPKLVYLEGLIAEQRDDTTLALETYQRAIRMKPNYKKARMAAAALLLQREGWQEAVNEYQYILQFIDPNDTMVDQRLEQLTATTSATVTPFERPAAPQPADE